MNINKNPDIRKLLDDELLADLNKDRNIIREEACSNIEKIQKENRKSFNKNRVKEQEYEIGELVAIYRTQFGTRLKIKPKYLGPYRIKEKLNHGRYSVERIGYFDGPKNTFTVAEYMKKWNPTFGSNA